MKGVRLSGEFSEYRALPREAAIALSIGGSTHAVMMASPDDLVDFAYGFLLADGVIAKASDIDDVSIVETDLGIDVQVRLQNADEYRAQKRAQNRTMVGPVGCGLCGVESLELAVPNLVRVKPMPIETALPFEAVAALADAQNLRQKSGALHAAGLYDGSKIIHAREDIGRHNALDKSLGAMLRESMDSANLIAVISSRISLDLVIKAVRAGIGTLIGRASPSDLAVKYAEIWGLKLIAPVFKDEYFISGELS